MDSDSDDAGTPAQIAAIPNMAITSTFVGRPPAPFLETPDSDKESWNVWIKSWENYLVVLSALSPGAIPDSVKNAMLLNALGTEGFRLATSDPILSDPTASYTAAAHATILSERFRGPCHQKLVEPPTAIRRNGEQLRHRASCARPAYIIIHVH